MVEHQDLIRLTILALEGRSGRMFPTNTRRAIQALANYRLAVLDEEYDEFIELSPDGSEWDWVSPPPSR